MYFLKHSFWSFRPLKSEVINRDKSFFLTFFYPLSFPLSTGGCKGTSKSVGGVSGAITEGVLTTGDFLTAINKTTPSKTRGTTHKTYEGFMGEVYHTWN